MNGRNPLVNGVLIGLFGASLGFGASQMTIAHTVTTHTANFTNLRNEFDSEKKRTDERIYKLADMVNATLSQNKEFISLIREQNALFKQALETTRLK